MASRGPHHHPLGTERPFGRHPPARDKAQAFGIAGAGTSEWIVFRVTDISAPPVDLASDDVKKLKETLQRGLNDELISQYVVKLESEIGTTINEAAFAQVTGANN